MSTRAAFFGEENQIARVYARGRRERVASLTDLFPTIVSLENFDQCAGELREVEVIFSTWGFPTLTAAHLEQMPKLRAVFYAAGTVRAFAAPLLERKITLVSAWQANAVPVAEFSLAQILLATKGYFQNTRNFERVKAIGNFGETVALLGAGAIGRKVVEMLRPFELKVIVFDPFLSEDAAAKMNVEKVSLDDAFARALIVSNHLANVPETVGMLRGPHLASMREDATFINTGRGATVEEPAMISVLQARPDLTALLDVTWPEPPAADSPLRTLPNVFLTTHIAGSIGDEVIRMADYCLEEFLAWQSGAPLRFEVTPKLLETMA